MKCGNCVEEFAGQGMNRIGHGMNGMGFGVHWIIGALVGSDCNHYSVDCL